MIKGFSMSVRDVCFKFYWKCQSVIAPTLKYSQTIYEDVLKENMNKNYNWLDLGCGLHILPPWRYNQETELVQNAKILVGLDYDLLSLRKHKTIHKRVRGDIKNLPFSDNTFHLITSNMVFEHLEKPESQIAEIYRILKPGGVLLFHTPNSLSYGTIAAKVIPEFLKGKLISFLQKRKEQDIFPTFYRINSRNKINNIAQKIGFRVDEIKMIVSSAQLVMRYSQ
jgi:ubiquinone/menaquinone biosynthesis C-methylase UbiE